jgi:hypothetical protein
MATPTTKNVLITLTTAGANVGPFNLFSDVDGYTSPFITGISKASLVAGYTSTLTPIAATVLRVKSNGVCLNYIDLSITGTTTTNLTTTTTTTTSTTTTTAAPTTMTVSIFNSTASALANFTVQWNTGNCAGLTNITLPASSTTGGSTNLAVVGTANTVVLTDNFISNTISITDVRDNVTGISIPYTIYSGNGTNYVTLNPLTLTSGNKTNGILIMIY